MRSVLLKLSLVAMALSLVSVTRAQVNPNTQINWPDVCNAPGMVYNVQSNTCIAVGTAANPGGTNTQIQFNSNGLFAGSNITTDSTHNNLSVPGTVTAAIIGTKAVVAGYAGANADAKFAAAQTAAAGQPAIFQVNQAAGTTFTSAITTATGQTIEVTQGGTYVFDGSTGTTNGITLGTGSSLICDVPGTVIQAGADMGGNNRSVVVLGNNSAIQGCTIDGNNLQVQPVSATSVSNVNLTNDTFENTANFAQAQGILFISVTGFTVSHNLFNNINSDALSIQGNSSQGVVDGNIFDSSSTAASIKHVSLHSKFTGQQVHDVAVVNNTMKGNPYFNVEAGTFGGLAPYNLDISHNLMLQTGVDPNGNSGGISCGSCNTSTFNNNHYFNFSGVPGAPGALEMAEGVKDTATGNVFMGAQISINKQSASEFSHNLVVGMFQNFPASALLTVASHNAGLNAQNNIVSDNIFDRTGMSLTTVWTSNTLVGIGTIIRDSNNNLEIAVGIPNGQNAGTTGSVAPTWPTTVMQTTTNTVDFPIKPGSPPPLPPMTVASGTGIAFGQLVNGPGLAKNTIVETVSGTSLTLSDWPLVDVPIGTTLTFSQYPPANPYTVDNTVTWQLLVLSPQNDPNKSGVNPPAVYGIWQQCDGTHGDCSNNSYHGNKFLDNGEDIFPAFNMQGNTDASSGQGTDFSFNQIQGFQYCYGIINSVAEPASTFRLNDEGCTTTFQAGSAAKIAHYLTWPSLYTLSNVTGIQGNTGTKLLVCAGSFITGDMVATDGNGNCIDGGPVPVGTATYNFNSASCTATNCGPLPNATWAAGNAGPQTMVSSVPGSNGVEYTFKGEIAQNTLGTSCSANSVKVKLNYTSQDTNATVGTFMSITPSNPVSIASTFTAATTGTMLTGSWTRTFTAKSGTAITWDTESYTATGCSPNWTYTLRPLLITEYQNQ